MVETVNLTNYESSLFELLNLLKFDSVLSRVDRILIKPNLLEDVPPPCTTSVECIEALVRYIKSNNPQAQLAIIEGSGGCDTPRAFQALGYCRLAETHKVKLVDVDRCPLVIRRGEGALAYPRLYLPRILFEGYYFISVPTLKAHTITGVTLSRKNLIGLLPQKYYGGYWHYHRSDVHRVGVNQAIEDLNHYVHIDMAIIDAGIGQADSHLPGGRPCKPPCKKLVGGYEAWQVDRVGSKLLGIDPDKVAHLAYDHNCK